MSDGLDYEAARVDTYQKLLLPQTFFGWLNVTPRVGGRYTYYSTATGPGATTDDVSRWVFDTGAEVSSKASRLWPEAQNDFFQVDGLRHIIEPSINYAYIPNPNVYGTNQVPQFDYQLPSLRLLPITMPDYNSIDSIQGENVFRFGLHNKLQTKREGQVVNLVDWNVYTDWYLHPNTNQTTFSDLYSDLTLKPRSWLTLESLTRYDIHGRPLAHVADDGDHSSQQHLELDRRAVLPARRSERLADGAGRGQQPVHQHPSAPAQRELGSAGLAPLRGAHRDHAGTGLLDLPRHAELDGGADLRGCATAAATRTTSRSPSPSRSKPRRATAAAAKSARPTGCWAVRVRVVNANNGGGFCLPDGGACLDPANWRGASTGILAISAPQRRCWSRKR